LSVAFELNFLTAIVNEALIVIAFAVGLEKHRKAIDSKHAVVLRVVDHFDFLDIVLRKLRTLPIRFCEQGHSFTVERLISRTLNELPIDLVMHHQL